MSLFQARLNVDLCFRRFSKKVIVVTGCDTGLGYSLAQRCVKNNVAVVAGCLEPQGLGAQQLSKQGAFVKGLDVTDANSVAEIGAFASRLLKEQNSRLQAVVNNAGVMVFGEFEWQTPRLINHQISVNLAGPLNVAHQFLPMLQKDQGRLINIASHCALAGLPSLSVYAATKAALLNWNDTLRIEQSKYGVKVVSFIPGSFFGESSILTKQAQHAKEMLEGMSRENRSHHEPYFTKVQQYLSQLPHASEPKLLDDEQLFMKLFDALFSPNPQSTYKHEPMRYTLYHFLFRISPLWLRDHLIQKFVSLPKF